MAELEPRNFLQPCLLLLLRERADHGYELASRLRPMHDGEGDAGGIYRALRNLERQGLVRSEWCTSDVGPARRTYHVTSDGLACLDEQAQGLRHVHDVLHVFMERYARVIAADRRNGNEGVTDERADRAGTDRSGAERAGSIRSGAAARSGAEHAEHHARAGALRPPHRTDRSFGH